ncbi:DUF2062 domain-containing protein [Pseudooceanicola sp. LIPI14-2-Ac024]|uniref:DUF2062 domain-containing protein n=1 Tax=Pseudooceanicola sp. LIPI14-2-Ac024 TaxID=3344875 RepID=UPI0035D0423D
MWKTAADFFWPKGGWSRAFQYMKHRVQRLPDKPERIARGVFAGVFAAFTPFYGFHFITAALIAKLIRGNILASLLATFVGNPLTYVPIVAISLETGHFILGDRRNLPPDAHEHVGGRFAQAYDSLRHNFVAIFTDDRMTWHWVSSFYYDIFLPYLVGGIIPGLIAGAIAYYLSLPVIRAYQHRRQGALQQRLKAIKSAKATKAEGK